jgi:hypothetical protein
VFFNGWALNRISEHSWDYLIHASFILNSMYLVFVVLWHMLENKLLSFSGLEKAWVLVLFAFSLFASLMSALSLAAII